MTFENQEIQQLITSFQPLPPAGNTPGRLEPTLQWLADSTQKWPLSWNHPRLSLFWANHGFAEKGAESAILSRCLEGVSGLNRLAEAANTDLRLYEMDLDTPTADITKGADAAMSEEDMVRAMAYGMMSVEPGLNFMAIGAAGAGSEDSALALTHLHQGSTPTAPLLKSLIDKAGDKRGLDALRVIGGFEIAALCGAMLSARLANVSVLVEGPAGCAAYMILHHHNPHAVAHVRFVAVNDLPAPIQQNILPIPVPVSMDPGVSLAFAMSHLRNLVILSECQSTLQTSAT